MLEKPEGKALSPAAASLLLLRRLFCPLGAYSINSETKCPAERKGRRGSRRRRTREVEKKQERRGVLRERTTSTASRGAAITWARGTAVISRGASAEGSNAIMCRLYATIIARAHGAERRRNRRRDPINRPRWAPQRVAPVRRRVSFSPSPSPPPRLPGLVQSDVPVPL